MDLIKFRITKKALRNGKIFSVFKELKEFHHTDIWTLENTYEIISIDQLIYINPEGNEFYQNDIINFRANYSSKQNGWLVGLLVKSEFSWEIKVGEEYYNISEETDEFYYQAKVLGDIHKDPELLNKKED